MLNMTSFIDWPFCVVSSVLIPLYIVATPVVTELVGLPFLPVLTLRVTKCTGMG